MAATTILSLVIAALAFDCIAAAINGYGGVVTDHFIGLNPRSGGRFLINVDSRKEENCANGNGNLCTGPPETAGQLLYCCLNHCRNVLTDRSNCGGCSKKCGFGQLCCNGNCTVVAYDVNNCGKCGDVCPPGVRCEYGICGYA